MIYTPERRFDRCKNAEVKAAADYGDQSLCKVLIERLKVYRSVIK